MAHEEIVVEPDDPRLADYRDLRDGARRERAGTFVAEGPTVVRALLASPRLRTRSVLVSAAGRAHLADVLDPLGREVPVYVVPDALIRAVVGFAFHRGCLAVGERGPDAALEAFLGARLLVGLEELRAPDNVGGVVRNAHAFAADGVLLSPGCCDPLSRKAIRLSGGAALALPVARIADWPAALTRLRAAGFTLVALTPHAPAVDVARFSSAPPSRVVLLLGTEGEGLTAATLAAADVAVRVPLRAGVDSLNVATASGIVLHRLARGPLG